MASTSCITCDLAAGTEDLPGGRIHETAGWIVEHCIGPLGVGTLVVKPRRHVVHVADLNAAEAAEMGPLLRLIAQVVADLVDPDPGVRLPLVAPRMTVCTYPLGCAASNPSADG